MDLLRKMVLDTETMISAHGMYVQASKRRSIDTQIYWLAEWVKAQKKVEAHIKQFHEDHRKKMELCNTEKPKKSPTDL